MKKTFISSAYIYPLCPLNMNHAKMYVIADIIARIERSKDRSVFFPIASHYSGNSAQNISEAFKKIYSDSGTATNNDKKIFNMYKNFYGVPVKTLKSFTDPLNILNYYNQEILWELKSLDVLGDYESSYTTNHEDFPAFINTIISLYGKHNVLINNKKNELALDYENNNWKETTMELIERTEFIQQFHKNNIITGMSNITSKWGLLREDGFGVTYKRKWIIDPMFDSELFTVFDLYVRFKRLHKGKMKNVNSIFNNLFKVLEGKEKPRTILVKRIIQWLPCDIFICEEHLKNWIAKKMHAESLLLNKKFQTRKYFVLGMGLLNGKRMSASRGNAILARDLIIKYGTTKARLIIIMGGGNPSKNYSYDEQLPSQIDKLLNDFTNYYTYITSIARKEVTTDTNADEINSVEAVSKVINDNIIKGYYRQVIIELLNIFPSKYPNPSYKTANVLISIYKKYLDIFLPSLLAGFTANEKIKYLKS